jgi:hypothetical protein
MQKLLIMKGFTVKTGEGTVIRFLYYLVEAPVTCNAFDAELPFSKTFMHARVSGQEIWIDTAPKLDIIQENASVFALPGEVVIGPLKPTRVSTAGFMGIYYGEGKGVDSCNIFAKVMNEDMELLQVFGDKIWRQGGQELLFERMEGG